jgi:hypothetical protein
MSTTAQPAIDTSDEALQRILQAAEDHGDDTGEPEHQVGDLEDALREAWKLMSQDQRSAFMGSDCIKGLLGLDDEE